MIFQGQSGYSAPFFQQNIRTRSLQPSQLPTDFGLLSLNPSTVLSPPGSPLPLAGNYASTNPLISVQPLNASPPAPGVTWGENTFSAVTQGYAILTSQGQAGPYALILNTAVFADLYAAVGLGSLVITADRVAPLVKAGLFGTGTIPPDVSVQTSPPTSPPGATWASPPTECWFLLAATRWIWSPDCMRQQCSCSRTPINCGAFAFLSVSRCE